MLRFDLVDPADVNGDNVFELAAVWSYYEGGGVSLFSLDQVPEELLLTGCGLQRRTRASTVEVRLPRVA
jgi:hypothetical protein